MITFSHLALSSASREPVSFGAPIYLLTEELKSFNDEFGVLFSWVENSDPSYLEIGHGKLVHVGDGNNQSGTSFVPSNAQYTQEGWIDLGNRPIGDGTKYIDTGWEAPQNSSWSVTGIYNVDYGVSYSMYAIDYHGDQTCDVYLYDYVEGVDFPTEPTYTNIPYTPPAGNWKIYEEPPSVIHVSEIEYTMATFNTV